MSDYYIKTDGLTAGYDGKAVVDEINLTLSRGRIMTLIGPNGAGKSTVLKTISRRLEPVAGTVYLDGREMKAYSGGDLAKKLSIVLTDKLRPELMTCFDVAATGRYPYTGRFGILSERDKELVRAALKRVNAEELSDLDFTRISDGQRQRVLLARALCQQPEIIILDEPTSFLDIKHKAEFVSLLHRMVREENLAVIMSLHELDLAQRVSDTIVCVNGGKIERCGAPEEIITAEYISRLYGVGEESFNSLYGTMELDKPCAPPRAFVIGGGGSGAAVYRRLRRDNIPFAAGVLSEGDLEFPIASALAAEVISESAFEPVGDASVSRALSVLKSCEAVYCPVQTFGTMNAKNKILKDTAEKLGILKY